jgi:hypothetical protein
MVYYSLQHIILSLIRLSVIKSIINISWPATLQFIIASGSWIVVAKLVAETGGTAASAGYQVAIRNVVFFILPAWGLSNAAATLVGQNLGAKEIERAEQSVIITAKYNAAFMTTVMIIFFLFADQIIIFLPTTHEVDQIRRKIFTDVCKRVCFLRDWHGDDPSPERRGRHQNSYLDKPSLFLADTDPAGLYLIYTYRLKSHWRFLVYPCCRNFAGISGLVLFQKRKMERGKGVKKEKLRVLDEAFPL